MLTIDQHRFTDDYGAGTAVPFTATFLGAGAVEIFAQVLQHGAGRGQPHHLMNCTVEQKPDRLNR